MKRLNQLHLSIAAVFIKAALLAVMTGAACAEIPSGKTGFTSHIKPFFETHCVACHGPEKSKGKITVHSLDGELAAGQELERWELILDALEHKDMPPEDEGSQPTDAERVAVVKWIESGLHSYVKKASKVAAVPTARRLTNFEYQNTMRDLLGFELDFSQSLPEDPKKPYHFNNSAEFMLIGPEQVDRYLDNARRAMASAIVDPGEPEVIRKKWSYEPRGSTMAAHHSDEVHVYGGNRGSPARGVSFKEWPATGEYRIRIKAAAILPKGIPEVPLRLVMGTSLRSDAGTGTYYPVGTVHLSNDVDHLEDFEFRGRIENHPVHVGRVTKNGQEPNQRYIYAQNLFDNGELNDHRVGHQDGGSWGFDAPRAVVREIEFEAPVTEVWPPLHHTRILFDSPLRESDPKAYVREVLQKFMTRAFRRTVSEAEVNRFARLYEILEPEFGSLEATMRETLSMVLIAPQFLYHTVAGVELTSPQFELASRLSFFLWGSMPDDALLNAAWKGELDDPQVLEAHVRRLLNDERSGDFVGNFTTQWMSIEKMKAVNINLQLFPRFLYTVGAGERRGQEVLFRPTIRDYIHEETIGFVAELIRRNASVRNIVDSDFAWLNEPLAYHYGVDGVQGLQMRAVPIKPEHRLGGLPTQGSILIGNSTGSAPHPIYRAVWLREALLGDEVKPPPAEVPALTDSAGDSADEAVTIKDLLAKHREVESCNDCHVRLDPWGIPFERYNAIGKFQPVVPKEGTRVEGFLRTKHEDGEGYLTYLETLNKVTVDATARVPHGPEVNGMQDLKDYLLKERVNDIAENVIRRLLTYSLGRALTYRDRYAVEELVKKAKGSDYALGDMIVSVCLSDTFRKTPTNTEKQ
ncbi:MAG: DUF1592 domain-containing protein [Akkermansiaceae bacterium]